MESSRRYLFIDTVVDRFILKFKQITLSPWSNFIHSKNTRFRECFTCFGCETKTAVICILVIFQHGSTVCLATSKKSPCRDLLNDLAEHRPILKKGLCPFWFHTQNRYRSPLKQVFRCYCVPKTGMGQHKTLRVIFLRAKTEVSLNCVPSSFWLRFHRPSLYKNRSN